MMIYQKIIVHGKVQGVSFRKSAAQKANELSVKGYVINLSDGTVMMEAEGYQASMDEFIEWCYIGSVMSDVKKIDIMSGEVKGYKSFRIKK
ncbi:acylphosphatase [Flavobacteriales bacterium]|jgi:acylphosphatase|nr:acylphosphatase [Flavobacteriales bacterium]